MKRLISARDVELAAKAGTPLTVDGNTLVTPQARDIARELGVELVDGVVSPMAAPVPPVPVPEPVAKPAVECGLGTPCAAEPALSPSEMERIIRAAVERGIWDEGKLEGIKSMVAPAGEAKATGELSVTVGVSGRHVHLSQAALEALFGAGHELTPLKELSQPGQFAAKECVTLVGPKGVIERVRVLGPVRPETQVEILAGDSFKLGVPVCVRMSGKLEGTPGVTLAGPAGTLALDHGVIVAARHIHMHTADAAAMGLHDGQVVSIEAPGERGGILGNVVIRANDTSALDCHIDTEEANALQLKNGSVVRIIR